MRFKCTLGVFAIAIGALLALPSAAMASQQRSDQITSEVVPEVTPEGLIVIKILPATEAVSTTQSNEPRTITDRRDPEYVRCRLEPVVGSGLKKRKICMTNRAWKLAVRKGNTYAKQFVADNQSGFFTP